MSNALTVIEPQEIVRYGARIRELMPGGDKLTEQEAQALAQVALLHQLSPFAKELWYLKTDDGRSLGIMAGIAGLRRASSLQLEREGGGSSWCEFDGPFTKEQCKALAIPDNALAYRAKLYDTRSMLAYTEGCERLLKAGMPWEAVRDALGARPYTEGIGYWTPGERTKMKPVQCAQKRAEAEARRRRFNLPFGSGVGSAQDPDADAVDAEYTVKSEPAQADKRAAGSAALYGEPDIEPAEPEPAAQPFGHVTDPDLIRAKVTVLVGARDGQEANNKQRGLAASMLERCFNADDAGQRIEMRHRVTRYLFGVDSGQDLAGHHWLAVLDWLKPSKDGDGHYQPSEGGRLEAQIIEHAGLLAEGQGQLFDDPLLQQAQELGGVIVGEDGEGVNPTRGRGDISTEMICNGRHW